MTCRVGLGHQTHASLLPRRARRIVHDSRHMRTAPWSLCTTTQCLRGHGAPRQSTQIDTVPALRTVLATRTKYEYGAMQGTHSCAAFQPWLLSPASRSALAHTPIIISKPASKPPRPVRVGHMEHLRGTRHEGNDAGPIGSAGQGLQQDASKKSGETEKPDGAAYCRGGLVPVSRPPWPVQSYQAGWRQRAHPTCQLIQQTRPDRVPGSRRLPVLPSCAPHGALARQGIPTLPCRAHAPPRPSVLQSRASRA